MSEDYRTWIKRAESSLELGLVEKTGKIAYEDLCYQLQQAVEKVMKAYLIYHRVEPPITHSFAVLLKKVRAVIEYPQEIERTIELEDYAVQTRYPGEYAPVEKEEYEEAVRIARNAVEWFRENMR